MPDDASTPLHLRRMCVCLLSLTNTSVNRGAVPAAMLEHVAKSLAQVPTVMNKPG